MKISLVSRMLSACILVTLGLIVEAHANLFVGEGGGFTGKVSEYTESGALVNSSVIGSTTFIRDIAIFEDRLFVLRSNGTIGLYKTSGQTIDASLITGFEPGSLTAIAIAGENIFIGTDENGGTIAQYTTSGALVNPSLISGLQADNAVLSDLAVFGGNLFVSSFGGSSGGKVGEYTLSGAPINPALITTDALAGALAVTDSRILLHNSPNFEECDVDTIGAYNLSGSIIDPAFISGLTLPVSIAVADDKIFVAEVGCDGSQVGVYDLSGEPIDRSLITGVEVTSIAIGAGANSVPESLSALWAAITIIGLLAAARLRGQAASRRSNATNRAWF